MSQSSTLGGERYGGGDGAKAASAGRAVLVLALAAIVGFVVLQQLDDVPAASNRAAVITPSASQGVQPAPGPALTASPPVTSSTARSPADVKVLVANGIGATGVASKVAGRLQPIGYQLLKPGNTVNRETNSLVQYSAGYAAEAAAVANSLGLPASGVQPLPVPNPVADMQGAHLVVVVGNDLANAPLTQAAQPQTGTNVQSGGAGAAGQGATQTTFVNPAINGPLNQAPAAQPNPQPTVANPQR